MSETFTQRKDAQNYCKNGIHYVMDGTISCVQYDEFQYIIIDVLKLIQPSGVFCGALKNSLKNETGNAIEFGLELNAMCDQFRDTVSGIKENGGLVMTPDALYFEQKFTSIENPDFLILREEFRDTVRKCIANNYKEAERLNAQGCKITVTEKSKYTQQRVIEEIAKK